MLLDMLLENQEPMIYTTPVHPSATWAKAKVIINIKQYTKLIGNVYLKKESWY